MSINYHDNNLLSKPKVIQQFYFGCSAGFSDFLENAGKGSLFMYVKYSEIQKGLVEKHPHTHIHQHTVEQMNSWPYSRVRYICSYIVINILVISCSFVYMGKAELWTFAGTYCPNWMSFQSTQHEVAFLMDFKKCRWISGVFGKRLRFYQCDFDGRLFF